MTDLTNDQFETCNEYLVLVSNLTGVPVDDIMSNQQTDSISQARHLTMWALVTLCGYSHTQTGALMRRHNTSVAYAVTHITRGYGGREIETMKNQIKTYHKNKRQ
jgi:chromosomal replication initiation ATPase DnaA